MKKIIINILAFLLTIFPSCGALQMPYQSLIFPGQDVISKDIINAVETRNIDALEDMMCLNIKQNIENLPDEIGKLIDFVEGDIIKYDRNADNELELSSDGKKVNRKYWNLTVETTDEKYDMGILWEVANNYSPEETGIRSIDLKKYGESDSTNLLIEISETGSADEAKYSGNCGSDLTWALNINTGVLSIVGSGKMTDRLSSEGFPWSDYRNYIKTINLPEGLTNIGDYAFESCSAIESITLPSSVISIGYSAFRYCSALKSVELTSNVTEIGSFAFSDCASLAGITIPSSVTSMGDSVFSSCSSLTSVAFEEPCQLTSMGKVLFGDCSALTSFTVPTGITSIDERAFYRCKKLSNITIPSGVTSIGEFAFSSCTELKSITIPFGMISIDDYAFEGCRRLESVNIPSSVTSVGSAAFVGTAYLNNTANWDNGVLYNGTILIDTKPFFVSSNLSIRNTTTVIADSAFNNCDSISSVNIPSSVTNIGSMSFSDCNSLETVNFESDSSLTTIDSGAFYGCDSLKSVEFPLSLKNIDAPFPYCTALSDVYYAGSESDRTAMTIDLDEFLSKATWHYNCTI